MLMDITERLNELKKLIVKYQDSYYKTGKSEVSDSEYDRLFDELLNIEKGHPELITADSPSKRVGSDLTQDFPEVSHTIPVLSLDKAYTIEEIYSFIKRVGTELNNDDLSFILEEKIDGFSIVLYYEDGFLVRAITRGNGYVGNDVTENVKTIKTVPLKLTEKVNIAVRGEIFLLKNDFKKINESLEDTFANPRNLASGTIRRIKSSETAKVPLTIFCYEGFLDSKSEKKFHTHIEILEYLKKLGFNVDKNISIFSKKKINSLFTDDMSFNEIPDEILRRAELRESLPYEIDGLVLKVNEIDVRDKLGFTEHHPRWAIAYKFQSPQAESQVLNIDVQVGRTGRITPMARINPVTISGSEIKNATLHNQDYINQLELCIGDTVAVSKRGDVIPAVEYVTEKNTLGNTIWHIPENCPVCNCVLVRRGAHLFCPNTECKARKVGALIYFCAKKQMNIQGLGEKVLNLLYENGYVKEITDIYTFSPDALLNDNIEGFGQKKVMAIKDAIFESKKQPFRRLLAALGIDEFSHNAIDLVIRNGIKSYDDFKILVKDKENAFKRLSSIDGLGPETSNKIIEAFTDVKILSILNFFDSMGFKMEEESAENTQADLILSGQSWCVTGTFEKFKSRDLIHDIIRKHGGRVVTSISGNTTHLLVGENAGSKLNKALNLGVKILYESDFIQLLNSMGEVYGKET